MTTKAAAAIMIEFDGIKIKAWSEDNGETHLAIDDNEEIHISATTANILGNALIALSKPED